MRVLIVHNILWSHYKSVLFEAIQMNKTGDMEICVLQIAKSEISRKSMAPIQVDYNYNCHLLFDDYIENISTFDKIIAVIKYIKHYKPDVVNITGWAVDFSMTVAIFYSFLTGRKVIISNESTVLDKQRSFFKEVFKKLMVKMSTGFITFGKSSREYLVKLGALDSQFIEDKAAVVDDNRIRLIYEQAKNEGFLDAKVKTKHNFIFIGRTIPVKNIPLLIGAFQSVKARLPDAQDWGLLLVGNGELDQHIDRLIEVQNTDIYKFDAVDWQTVPKFFVKSDCLILPSNSETWGLVVNEAMICGLAIIVSDACGCKDDLIEGNGFVFEAGDQKQLEDYMSEFILNPAMATKMKLKSIMLIEQFKVNKVAERITEGFRKLTLKS